VVVVVVVATGATANLPVSLFVLERSQMMKNNEYLGKGVLVECFVVLCSKSHFRDLKGGNGEGRNESFCS
jgi:hypothetical protein